MVTRALHVSRQNSELNQGYSYYEDLKNALDILDQQNAKLELQANEANRINDFDEQRRVFNERKKVEKMLKLLRNGDEVEGSGSRANKGNSSHESLEFFIDDDIRGLKIKETPMKFKNIDLDDDLIFDGEFVWPLTGIVVNLPTRIEESKLRDEFLKRGFNPINITYMWDQSGFIALVDFEQGLTGLCKAMSFERAHEKDHHGKKDWLFCNKNKNNGLFAWIARAEDYNSAQSVIGAYLRSNGVLKDFMRVYLEEEFESKDKNVLEITNDIEVKTKYLKKTALELSDGILSLCDLVERKDKILKTHHEDVRRVRLSARGYFQRCLKEQEKLKFELETKTKELESREKEFEKKEARRESQIKELESRHAELFKKLATEHESEIETLADHIEKIDTRNRREVRVLEFQIQNLIIKGKNANHEPTKSDALRLIELEKRKKMEKKIEKKLEKKRKKKKKKMMMSQVMYNLNQDA